MLHWFVHLQLRRCGASHNVNLRGLAEALSCSGCWYIHCTATASALATLSILEPSSTVIVLQSRWSTYCTVLLGLRNESTRQKKTSFVRNLRPFVLLQHVLTTLSTRGHRALCVRFWVPACVWKHEGLLVHMSPLTLTIARAEWS